MKLRIALVVAISILAPLSAHAAGVNYTGKWDVNLPQITQTTCGATPALGKDRITVKQTDTKITFVDLDKDSYKGKVTSTGFNGTLTLVENNVRMRLFIDLSGVKTKSSGIARARMTFTGLTSGQTCEILFLGTVKKNKH